MVRWPGIPMSRVGGLLWDQLLGHPYVGIHMCRTSTKGHEKVGAGAEVMRHSACSSYINWLTCSKRAYRHEAKLPCELSSIDILHYKRL